ncbi:MAG: ABC transporter substrate-binding protein [Anaerolineales bacterium]|nr:ABC transporter substrate-binding protein [Anaerolineales bacterium]
MRKNALILSVLVILSMLMTACGAAQPEVEKSILIGGALSLTGIQAPLDEPGLRGAELAIEELNNTGGILGRPVKFINLDGKSDPVTVGNVAVQLIEQGAVAIVAPCDFDFGGPASREAQAKELVGISTCASSPLYGSEALGDKQFTLSMWNTTMGAAAAEYAYKEKGWRSVYVVTDSFIDYTTSLSEYFIVSFKDLGGEVIFEDTYTQGDQDFSAQLARIQALEKMPDFLYISS